MAKEYFGVRATTALTRLIKSSIATKQDKLTGAKGQVLGFDEDGNPIAQEAPVTGMTQDAADERYLQKTGVDDEPTDESENLVKSGGVKAALDEKVDTSDSRLTDPREPTSHAASHGTDGDDPISPASIGAMEAVTGETNQYVGFDEDGKPVAKDMSADVQMPEHLVRAEDEDLPDVELVKDADTLDGHPADYFASKDYVDEKEVELPDHLITGEDSELPEVPVSLDADTLQGHKAEDFATKEYVDEKEVVLPDHLVSTEDGDHLPDAPMTINADTLEGQPAAAFVKKVHLDDLERILAYAPYLYDGVNIKEKFAGEMDYTDPWIWIQQRLAMKDVTGLHIKDFFEVMADGNLLQMQIGDINHDLYFAEPEIVLAHIDFISKDMWPIVHQWNKAKYNNGLKDEADPWLCSDLKAWLNSEATTVPNSAKANPDTISVDYSTTGVFDKLPVSLQNIIIERCSLEPLRFKDGELLTDDTNWAWKKIGKLWVPNETEVYGQIIWGTHNGYGVGETHQFPIFTDGKMRIKRLGVVGSRSPWWFRSVASGDSTQATIVGYTGGANPSPATNASVGAPVCFRISG